MAISSDRIFRGLLLRVALVLWTVTLPPFAQGIVGPAVTRDVVTSGALSVALVFHTVSFVLLASIYQRSQHRWGNAHLTGLATRWPPSHQED